MLRQVWVQDWVFPTPSVEKRTMYHWTGDMLEERQLANKSMREVQGGRVRLKAQNYKPLLLNIRAECLVWYFLRFKYFLFLVQVI